ncbi:MAG: MOSC domain-containing protein [Usitatibacter sp.]
MAKGAKVLHIFVAPRRGAPMAPLRAVRAIAGTGLEGDRYTQVKSRFTKHHQVTFIEREAIEAFTGETGLALTPEMPRRNIVTQGVELAGLVGRRFRVGEALFEGAELCEPCSLFARRTHREVLEHLKGRGGLRAAVLEGGTLRVGDPVLPDNLVNFSTGKESDMRAFAHDTTYPPEGS